MLRILSMLSLQQWLYLSRDGSTKSAAWELGVPSRIWEPHSSTSKQGLPKAGKGKHKQIPWEATLCGVFYLPQQTKGTKVLRADIHPHSQMCLYPIATWSTTSKVQLLNAEMLHPAKKTEEIRFRIHEMHTDPRKKNRKLTKSSKSSVKTGQLHWSLEIPSPPDTLAAVLSCLDQAWHSCSTALGPAATAASLNGGLRDEWDEWDDYSGDRIRLGWKLCYQCAM
jgi:hypothetical protein